MKTCRICERPFPPHLIQAMVTNKGTLESCPLCALKARNAVHGLPDDTPFHGPIAARMHKEASEFISKGKP
jgi:hypothetical protein